MLVGLSGLFAGLANTVAGGGTLVTFPVLIAAGVPPIAANITSAVGLVPGYVGSAVAYRVELRGQRARMRALALPSVLGGILGALLLLVTPDETFQGVVPFLILISCLLLALQPTLARLVSTDRSDNARPKRREAIFLFVAILIAGAYGSFFAAGLGVLLLAVLGIFIPDDLQRLNGLKSLLSVLVVLAGVVVYLMSGHVHVEYVVILLVTSYIGGMLGGKVARRISPTVLRVVVCVLGVMVAVVLLVRS